MQRQPVRLPWSHPGPHHHNHTDEVGVTSLAKVSYPVSEHDAALAHPSREVVSKARRVVIKVGSAVVTRSTDSRLALGRLGALVEQIESLVRSGRQCILVTSGGVCVGRQRLRHQQVLNSSPLELQIAGPASVTSTSGGSFFDIGCWVGCCIVLMCVL